MKTTILKFGAYGLLCSFLLFLSGLYFGMGLDFGTQEVIGYLTIGLSLVFVYFGLRYYRDRVNAGKLRFGKAFSIGLLITLFPATGIALADVLYTTVINPDFFSNYAATMRSEGFTGEIPEYSSGFMALLMFLTVLIIGLVITVLSALILKRK